MYVGMGVVGEGVWGGGRYVYFQSCFSLYVKNNQLVNIVNALSIFMKSMYMYRDIRNK